MINTKPVLIEVDRINIAAGSTISGVVKWQSIEQSEPLELRLSWHTEGRGTMDRKIIYQQALPIVTHLQSHRFSIKAPEGPYSFTGRLIELIWTISCVSKKGKVLDSTQLYLSRDGRAVELYELAK